MILSISLLKRINRILLLTLPVAVVIPVGFQFGDVMFTWVEAIIISLIIVVVLIYLVSEKAIELFFLNRVFIPIIIFLSILFLSLIFSENPSEGIMIFIRLIEAIILMMVVLKSLKVADLSIGTLLQSLKIAGLVGSIYAIFQFYYAIGSIGGVKDVVRVYGFLHGGVFGVIPAIGFVLATISFFSKRHWFYKSINLVIGLICFLGLFLTLTRTWVLAAFIGVVVYFGSTSMKKLIASFSIIPFVLLMLFQLVISSKIPLMIYGRGAVDVFERYNEIFSSISEQGAPISVNMRYEKWDAAIDVVLKHPVLGVGLENLDLNVKWASQLGQKRSDSQWLDILAMGGIISFLLFVFMMLWMLLIGFKVSRLPGDLGNSGKKFLAVYCTWLTGSFFWAILYGFTALMFSLLVALGIYINDKMGYDIISKNYYES